MNKFVTKEFDFRIAAGVIVSGTVSGRFLAAEEHVGEEVDAFKVDARVYTHILDDVGVPFEEFEMTDELRKNVVQFAFERLCDQEEGVA